MCSISKDMNGGVELKALFYVRVCNDLDPRCIMYGLYAEGVLCAYFLKENDALYVARLLNVSRKA